MKHAHLTQAEWQQLAAVKDEQKKKAFNKLARWMHGEIIHRGFDPESGPFSPEAMGGNAIQKLCEECIEALFTGEWHWKPNYSLSTMLISIARSKIGHIIRDFEKRGNLQILSINDDDFGKQFERTVAAQQQREANLRDMGYQMARNAVKNFPKLVAYIDALYECNDYTSIAKRLHISKPKVMELEAQLLQLLENM